MRRNLLILSVFVLLAFAALPNVFAQKAQRITFKRGATTATVSSNLNGYRSRRIFVIRVRQGQTLQTEQIQSNNSSNYVTVFIKNLSGEDVDDSDASCNNRKIIEPTEAGDYKITVVECQKADAWRGNFKLKITVE